MANIKESNQPPNVRESNIHLPRVQQGKMEENEIEEIFGERKTAFIEKCT